MASVWSESVRDGLDQALELLAAAVQECPDAVWRTPMWRVDAAEITGTVSDVDGDAVTEPAQRDALVQRWSTPWSVAWHALEVHDYDLTGELDVWAPPPPFAGRPHWQTFTSLAAPWSKSDISGYVDYCRQRVQDTLANVTEERAATPLPAGHRYQGRPYAQIVTSLIGHTTAHAIQIRQFAAAAAPADTPS
jgi:hypothetical protein